MSQSMMDFDTVALSSIKSSSFIPVMKTGENGKVALSELADSSQGAKADSAIQSVKFGTTVLTPDAEKCVTVPKDVPDVGGASDGDVLTYDDTDGIVWKTPQGGSSLPTVPADHAGKGYVLGIDASGNPAWYLLDNGSGGSISYRQP